MKGYATFQDFATYGIVPGMDENDANDAIRAASIHINDVAFGRIEFVGLENLPERTQRFVTEATLLQANFYYKNKELYETNLKSYAVAGVSMTFEIPRGATQIGEMIVDNQAVGLIRSCGLMSQNFGWKQGVLR